MRRVVCFTLRPLCHCKRPQYPLNARFSGPWDQCGRFGVEISSLSLPAIESWLLGLPARGLVTILTSFVKAQSVILFFSTQAGTVFVTSAAEKKDSEEVHSEITNLKCYAILLQLSPVVFKSYFQINFNSVRGLPVHPGWTNPCDLL
jgi:hypothetical protein